MIRVTRPKNEPQALIDKRNEQLGELRKLVRDGASSDEIQKKITGYKVVRDDLWQAQHLKCCYCEKKGEAEHNDVEHYRPKLMADRSPGSSDRHGYWWLAFTWANLLYACSNCNRSNKNIQFPLAVGSEALQPEDPPHGKEKPLLLDPAEPLDHPVDHIVFRLEALVLGAPPRWFARPRNGSVRGNQSIVVYGLNRGGLLELRDDHVKGNVTTPATKLKRLLEANNLEEARSLFEEARSKFDVEAPYAALTYDAYRHYVSDDLLGVIGKSWPKPSEVGLPRAARPIRRPASS
ncbi:MAG TPA: hypothetical protein PK156_33195 [Polyangium sp.]|nr:hypothetical protein [Polyangium sp.]